MRGIAAGAGVPFEHIVLVNARTELLKIARRPGMRNSLRTLVSEGCTGVVVRPEATRDKDLNHAHNWDWQRECAESAVILRIRNDDGPDILTFTEAGALARFGFNARGICITATDWKATFGVEPQNGLLVHSNHWLSPVALSKLRECGMAEVPSTLQPHEPDRLCAVATLIMRPAAGVMSVAMLPALNRQFTRYSLETGRAVMEE
ncbi:MAG: C45 family autoproteolytic acyltransferase/hydrolase [Acetobacteraceae bacterium]